MGGTDVADCGGSVTARVGTECLVPLGWPWLVWLVGCAWHVLSDTVVLSGRAAWSGFVLESCSSLLCSLGVPGCACGVQLGHLAPVQRCARSVCCVACAVCLASWLLFNSVHIRCIVLRVRCPGPLGSFSPVCTLGVLCCVCGVLGHLAPDHRCACSVLRDASAVSWATWLLFIAVHAWCAVLPVQRPGPLGPFSTICVLGVLCCVYRPPGCWVPVHRCARSVRCVARAVSWPTWLLVTGVHVCCVLLRVRCPGPPGYCSRMCSQGVCCCFCGCLGHLAGVDRCASSVCCVACLVPQAAWFPFTGVHARYVVWRVRYPGPLDSCSPVCTFGVLCGVCGVLHHLAPLQRGACSVCCVACAVSWAN